MIYVDTNVFIYAVGRRHPLRDPSRNFLADSMRKQVRLAISAEVLQELMHVYLPVGRIETLDAAIALVKSCIHTVWPLEEEDVVQARSLLDVYPELGARDLLHLASCQRRNVAELKTYDRTLEAVSRKAL